MSHSYPHPQLFTRSKQKLAPHSSIIPIQPEIYNSNLQHNFPLHKNPINSIFPQNSISSKLNSMASIIIPSQSSSVFKQRRMTVRCTVADAAPTSMTMATRKSLYEVLRVKRNASQTEIKTAYRTLAKLYHPDATSRFMDSSIVTSVGKEGGDFIEIHDAYATLSDPDARSVYDMNLDGDSRRRRWNSISGMYNPTRRWETDQCW